MEYEERDGNVLGYKEVPFDKGTYEAYTDRKFANILERLKALEDKVAEIEKELRMDGEKELG